MGNKMSIFDFLKKDKDLFSKDETKALNSLLKK